jgi:hypothetical protein
MQLPRPAWRGAHGVRQTETAERPTRRKKWDVPPEVQWLRNFDLSGLNPQVFWRTEAMDKKGRLYTKLPRQVVTLAMMNPKAAEIRAGDLERLLVPRHGLDLRQLRSLEPLTNEELLVFRPDDPLTMIPRDGMLHLTGGHHRAAHIAMRVKAGTLSPDTPVVVLLHE